MLELNTTSPRHLILGFMQFFQTANVLLNVNAQITTSINQVNQIQLNLSIWGHNPLTKRVVA